jgi:hypothetical protein
MKRLLVLSVVVLTGAIGASAQTGGAISVFADPYGIDCTIVDIGLVELYVIHYGHTGATASEFMLDRYPRSWAYVGDQWNYPAFGDAISGVSISYGACLAAPTFLGVVRFVGSGLSNCNELRVGPAPGNSSVEAVDCASSLLQLPPSSILVNCGPCGVRPPYNLQPAEGADGVSLIPTLSWSWTEPTGCPEGIGLTIYTAFLGTHPDSLEQAGWVDTQKSVDVGPLDPNTVYYWQVKVFDDFYNCPGDRTANSAVQSFTTAGPVPVGNSTWGRIKDLYK